MIWSIIKIWWKIQTSLTSKLSKVFTYSLTMFLLAFLLTFSRWKYLLTAVFTHNPNNVFILLINYTFTFSPKKANTDRSSSSFFSEFCDPSSWLVDPNAVSVEHNFTDCVQTWNMLILLWICLFAISVVMALKAIFIYFN